MSLNLKRFEADIARLVSTAAQLELSMMAEVHGRPALKDALLIGSKEEKVDALMADLPPFRETYEAWYSEAKALIKQVLPDRLENFVGHYEVPKGRKEIKYGTYRIQDYMQGLKVTRSYGDLVVDREAAIPEFQSQVAILQAAKGRFKSSLFEIRQLVQADLFDSEIEAARELLKNKFLRAAGAVAGVVLEKHLRQVCDDHNLKVVKKNPTINDLNELLKSNGVIDVPQWRHIAFLGDIRNLCDHNKAQEPTATQVTDLIDGADKVLKTVS